MKIAGILNSDNYMEFSLRVVPVRIGIIPLKTGVRCIDRCENVRSLGSGVEGFDGSTPSLICVLSLDRVAVGMGLFLCHSSIP